MKFIITKSNSFVLGEVDNNGNVIEEYGFPKGGLSYLIKGNNVKFYLSDDFFYKNVVWSADAPLMIDGVLVSVENLPTALKKIFIQEVETIEVDTEFNTESFNAIANAPVSIRFNDVEASINGLQDDVSSLSGEVSTLNEKTSQIENTLANKADKSEIPDVSNFIEMSAVTDYTYSKSVIDEKIENVEVDAYTKTESDERFQPKGDYLSGNALNGYATEQWVESQGYLTEHQSLSAYSTTEEMNSAITAATDDMATMTLVGQQGYLTEHQDISGKQDVSGMTAYTLTSTTEALNNVVTAHTADTTIHVTTSDKETWNAKIASGDVISLFGNVAYDSDSKRINFYHESTTGEILAYIDATDFIKDGMVDNVEIKTISGTSYLAITFNSDAGKEEIDIPLTDIFDPNNYYTKQEVDNAITAATDDMATQTWVGEQGYLTEHQSLSAYSTTDEVNNAIEEATSGKADTSAVTAVNDVLTAHTADTTIHVTSTDKNNWNAKSDFSGSYNDLTDKPTIPVVPTNVSAFNNDAGYATSGYVDSVVSGKVDSSSVVTAVTSASTDNEIPTAKAVFDAIPTGGTGGGKTIEAGRGISVTTGETADTVSFNLPISAGTGTNAIKIGYSGNDSNYDYSFAGGLGSRALSSRAFAFGEFAYARGRASVAFGNSNYADGAFSFVQGTDVNATNKNEVSFGNYNVSNKANDTFGNSGNTLFSVGNGTGGNARHNAFEIRQNGDIYITKDGQDVKLQDQLGGGGSSYTAGDGIDITNHVISVSGVVMSSAITTSITSSSTDAQVPSAKAVNDKLGGLSLVKLTQAEYDALVQGGTVDSSTVYIIVN